MKIRVLCLLFVISLVAILIGCGASDDVSSGAKDTSGNIGYYTTDEDCFTIETRYGKLEFPEKWKEITKTEIVEGDFYSVRFFCVTSAGNIPLFHLNYNGGEGFFLGTLPVNGEDVKIYLDSFEIDQSALSEEEYINCCAMEEDVNVIISRLIEKSGFKISTGNTPSDPIEEDTSVYAIQTKYGKLSYPEKWKPIAKVEIVESPIYTVKFSCQTAVGEIQLFDLTFNGGNGYCLGQMTVDHETVTLYIDDYLFDAESMSEDDQFNCYAMQEDVNVILQHLSEDYGFTFS